MLSNLYLGGIVGIIFPSDFEFDIFFADFVKVRDYIGPRPFRGNMISLQQVEKTNVMCVRGFQNLDELIIKYYFESPSNGGGRIVKYESYVDKGYMLVHFEENSGR